MKARPTIFLSGVSHEFGSFRDAVENEIEMKGCFAENQPGFPPDYRTVEEMLRRKIADSDAVIHIVGFRFGAEPNNRPAGVPRRSYTQMEFDIAVELGKPLYRFISNTATCRDKPRTILDSEDAEAVQLQLDHRAAVQRSNNLWYEFKDKDELCKLAAEIPEVEVYDFNADISRIDGYAPANLIGRDDETQLLNKAWQKVRRNETKRPHVMTFVALGGEGKTSLVAKWAAALANENWPGCDSVLAWSFYSQGTRDQAGASSDIFLKEALLFFGDKAMANSAVGAYDKGKRLAQLIGERRALLILDGLEPLQYPTTSPLRGQLKDQGISALLKGLAQKNAGLCIVTTRYSVTDLKNYWQTTAPEIKLLRLSKEAGVELLKTLGVKGTKAEFEKLVEDVNGQALTLNLLGKYLHDAHAGDIRKRDLVKLDEANAEEGGHAFHVMDAYVLWFETGGKTPEEQEKGRRAIALLRLLGLFDRPASVDCIMALKQPPVIAGLTDVLVGLSEAERNIALTRLEDANLLTVNRDASSTLISLDAHPLLREYFAKQLREKHKDAWKAGHKRLYEHLRDTTKEGHEPSLEDLQPLYQAVAHGCAAGLGHQIYSELCQDRIWRRSAAYSVRMLGAHGSDLGAIACFFRKPWSQFIDGLSSPIEAFLLNCTSYCLRALGRLTEALEPVRESMVINVNVKQWRNAADCASNLSELEIALGDVELGVENAQNSVLYADQSLIPSTRFIMRTSHADALHQAGRKVDAEARFREAELIQSHQTPDTALLYGLQGFQFCDVLLSACERATWQLTVKAHPGPDSSVFHASCRQVHTRVAQTIQWMMRMNLPLEIALDHLTLSRIAIYEQVLSNITNRTCGPLIEDAVRGLRRAGTMHHMPRSLLTRAWYLFLTKDHAGAQADLDEAWEIAERGPMRLYMADIHLYRCRLFHAVTPYPWESPMADLREARKLITDCGYWRRKEELEDAEAAAAKQKWPG